MKRTDLFAALAPDARRRLRKGPPPAWVAPMLAVLTDERFSDEDWVFERKFDGIRCLAFRTWRRVRLISRNRQDQNNTYPELLEPLLEQDATDFIVDGEVVAFDGKRTSFARLQQRWESRMPAPLAELESKSTTTCSICCESMASTRPRSHSEIGRHFWSGRLISSIRCVSRC